MRNLDTTADTGGSNMAVNFFSKTTYTPKELDLYFGS